MSSTSTSPLDPAQIAGEVVGWGSLLRPGMSDALCGALREAYQAAPCHPAPSVWFDAFRAVGKPDDVRVCILGQDPQAWAPQGSPPPADADIGPEPSRVV